MFASCDIRYKGEINVTGFTVIPNQPVSPAQVDDAQKLTPNLESFVLDSLRRVTTTKSVKIEHPFELLHSRRIFEDRRAIYGCAVQHSSRSFRTHSG